MFLRLCAFVLLFTFAASSMAAPVVLHRGNVADPGTLDTHKYNLDYEAEILRDLFMGLVTYDSKFEVVPGLSEKWAVSPDGKTYTFTLRKGLVWSDGAPITADDAVFSLRRAADPKIAATYVNYMSPIVNSQEIVAGKMKPETLGVRAVDPLTVEIKLIRPAPVLLIHLANVPMMFPIPRHVLAKTPVGWTKPGTMVSSGAYVLKDWRPNDRVTLVKNPRFFDAKNVQIDEVVFYPTVEDSAALTRFRSGELDMNTRFPPNQMKWLNDNLAGQVFATPALWITYLIPNHRIAPFNDLRVRRALSLAIDRSILTNKVLRNGEKPYEGVVPDTIRGYVTPRPLDPRPLPQRQEEARKLLAQAGFGPAKPLSFTFSHRAGQGNRLAAVTVMQMWRDIGVKVELLQSDVAVHYNRLKVADFQFADAGWAQSQDPELFLYILLTASKDTNYGGYSNARFDKAVEDAAAIGDMAQRLKSFAEAEKLALADQAIIPLFISPERLLVKPYVKGAAINPLGQYPTRFIRIEGRK
jgi:oligopeptide transport system substrate-binding protein